MARFKNVIMDYPVCHKPMKKIVWRINSNGKEGDEYKEYERNNYKCEVDEVWLEIEMPIAK
jgi:hypothetical protein